jgi:hypothetical protein
MVEGATRTLGAGGGLTPAGIVVVAVAVFVALWASIRAKSRSLRVADLTRIERKVDGLTEAIRAYAGDPTLGSRALLGGDDVLPGEDREVTRSDLARVERKVDALVRGLGFEAARGAGIGDDIRLLWSEGRKIEAIRAYREANPGMGLKEAKETLEDSLG